MQTVVSEGTGVGGAVDGYDVAGKTGTAERADENGGYLCGFDWFNYPRESVHIKEVYPELWNWLTTDSSYDFADIYDGRNVPANACPAADLGLFEARTIDVTNRKYRAD